MKRFSLIGAVGYDAPRHIAANTKTDRLCDLAGAQ
jgi:hypothetical protein